MAKMMAVQEDTPKALLMNAMAREVLLGSI
jgi:hypothetical protein